MITSTATPAVVTRYLAAADAGDLDTLVACFTPDARVLDEGRTYRGRDEIRGWREAVAGRFSYTSTVTGSEPRGDDGHLVRTRLVGDFPGGVADLAMHFTVRDGLVADLAILA